MFLIYLKRVLIGFCGCCPFFVLIGGNPAASDTYYINWGTHLGNGSSIYNTSDTAPSGSLQLLKGFTADGSGTNALARDPNDNPSNTGDLIELGFFDTGGASTITPNNDSSNLFKGIWTPLTTQTTIGHQRGSADDFVDAGIFAFATQIYRSGFSGTYTDPDPDVEWKNVTRSQVGGGSGYQIDGGDAAGTAMGSKLGTDVFSDNIAALEGASNPHIGIRFYDTNTASHAAGGGGISKSNGATRYNTIMNQNWVWDGGLGSGNELELSLYLSDGSSLDSNLEFEFDNSNYNSLSDIGTGGTNAVGTDDFVTTITHYSGSGTLDLDNDGGGFGDAVLSGLNSAGTIEVGDDSNIVTINATGGNTYTYTGTLQENGNAGAASLVKTGAGEQIFTGAINLAGSSTGFVDVYEGTLTFKGSAGSQSVEYLKTTDDGDGATTPIVKLDNTTATTGELIELGFANTTSAQTFTGNIELTGANSAHKIKISSGVTADDYSKEQIIDGTITSGHNDMTLVKDGVGRLTLHGDSDSTMGAGITIENGTLVVGDGSDAGADPGTGAIVINKGKLEVAENEIIDNTITGAADKSGGTYKSMIGGAGQITSTLTVGDSNGEIDYISPGRGISSSLTPSKKGVDLDASTDAIGTLTVGTLHWNDGGVFDWQIKDFNPDSGTAGSDWDKLAFTTLNFESSSTFDINIMALKGSGFDGTQGLVSNNGNTWKSYSGTNGFLFADGPNGSISGLADGNVNDRFSIRADDYNYHTGYWYGDWGVYHDAANGDLYLTYSVAPEPSTYIMVAGLLMLPGYNFIRRFRKSGDESKEV